MHEFEKWITIETKTDKGIFLYNLDAQVDSGYLTKTAAEYHPDIAQYIRTAQPVPGQLQVLVTALGAHEYYGPNSNGDAFPEEGLKHEGTDYGYKTFEHSAKVYKHHINKPDSPSYGTVRLAVWNDRMKRVELILILDRQAEPGICARIDNGEYPPLSMGARVPYDICSICGNKAKNRSEYCEHLKFYMNKIPPGYTKIAFAFNTIPRFFDISFVIIGADSIAKVMRKVASAVTPPPRESGYDYPADTDPEYQLAGVQGNTGKRPSLLVKAALLRKGAEMTKEVPSNLEGNVNIPNIVEESGRILRANEPRISPQTIELMAGGPATPYTPPGLDRLSRVLSTLIGLGIVPHRDEMRDISLHAMGGRVSVPEEFIRERLDIHPDNFDERVMSIAKPLIPTRSYAAPVLHKRIIIMIKEAQAGRRFPMTKTADVLGPVAMMAFLAGVFKVFAEHNPSATVGAFENFVRNNTAVAAALGAGAVVTAKTLLEPAYRGKYDVDPGTGKSARPLTIDQYVARANDIPYVTNSPVKTAGLAHRVFIGAPATYIWSGVEEARHARNPEEPEGVISETVRKHPAAITAGLVGDAALGQVLYGKPVTHEIVSKGAKLLKVASAFDTIGSGAADSAILRDAAKLLQVLGKEKA